MQHVLSTLPVSTSHFIRCIQTSPTHTAPTHFNRAHVSQQISNLAVLETVDMLSNNYCYRYTFDEFLARYLVLNKLSWLYIHWLPQIPIITKTRPWTGTSNGQV